MAPGGHSPKVGEGPRWPEKASPHPPPPGPATLTRPASSPLAMGTASRGRCHSPGPQPPAAAPAWPASPRRVPAGGGQLGQEARRTAAAPSIRRARSSAPRSRLAAGQPCRAGAGQWGGRKGADAQRRARPGGWARAPPRCRVRSVFPGARSVPPAPLETLGRPCGWKPQT